MAKAKGKSSRSAREKRAARTRASRTARRRAAAESETQRRLDELFAADTPVDRSAAVVIERLAGGPAPPGIARFFAIGASEERARAVAVEVARREPGSPAALTLAADIASNLDGDAELASTLLDRALAAVGDPAGRITLAGHLIGLGRVADTLAIVEAILLEEPEDEDAERIRAYALALAYRRLSGAAADGDPAAQDDELAWPDACECWSGRAWVDCCRPVEQRAVERFADRTQLYALGDAMDRFAAETPAVGDLIDRHVAGWLVDAGADSRADTDLPGLERIATEHAWVLGDVDAEDDWDAEDADEAGEARGAEDPDEAGEAGAAGEAGGAGDAGAGEADRGGFDRDAPLAVFAVDARTSERDAAGARRWLEHCSYGLWQVADPTPGPGVWVTEIMTGVRRYAAVASDQLERAARWTVLLGALVAIDGTWRTTGGVVVLRPGEADAAGSVAEEMIDGVVSAITGRQVGHGARKSGRPRPLGVLARLDEPAPPAVADVVGKVIGSGMPTFVGLVGDLRDAAPRLVNTDGDTLCIVKATVGVADLAGAAARLSGHPDVELDDGVLVWWGRELDVLERETSLAEVRAQLRARGDVSDVGEPDGLRRWLRGRIRLTGDGFEVEVNSRERLDRFVGLLEELGEQPVVSGELVIDPAQDMPQLRSGSMIPFGASEEANAAWSAHWPDRPLEGFGGRTPRRAAQRAADRPRVEAIMREFEHDADVLARHGLPAPDVDALRVELDMPVDAWE